MHRADKSPLAWLARRSNHWHSVYRTVRLCPPTGSGCRHDSGKDYFMMALFPCLLSVNISLSGKRKHLALPLSPHNDVALISGSPPFVYLWTDTVWIAQSLTLSMIWPHLDIARLKYARYPRVHAQRMHHHQMETLPPCAQTFCFIFPVSTRNVDDWHWCNLNETTKEPSSNSRSRTTTTSQQTDQMMRNW